MALSNAPCLILLIAVTALVAVPVPTLAAGGKMGILFGGSNDKTVGKVIKGIDPDGPAHNKIN